MFSLYCSFYNSSLGLFDWKTRLLEFKAFGEELVVSTTTDCKDNTIQDLTEFCGQNDIKLIVTDILFSDLAFDGKLKDAALQACSQEFCILLDMDEAIPLSTKHLWIKFANQLKTSQHDGLLIPSINLCGSEQTYKDIGYKFYLHKNHIGLKRGIVNFAQKDNGKIDITKSDTTEILTKTGDLARCYMFPNNIEALRGGQIPYVFHYWGVDKDKRIKQNQWWNPVWQNRAGQEVKNDYKTHEDFYNIETFEHKLPLT